MKRLLILALLVIASPALSCEPEISPFGQGRYLSTIQAATGFSGTKHLRAKALRSAASFCEGKAVDFETLTAAENDGPFVLGKYPRAEDAFRCVPLASK